MNEEQHDRTGTILLIPPSLTEVFHRVNSLIPENQSIAYVPPETPVAQAIDMMNRYGFSQLPVLQGNQVLGVFSYRSFASRIIRHENEKIQLAQLSVEDFMERLQYAQIDDDINKIRELLSRDDAVLVGQSTRLQGIVTPMDVLSHLYKFASPFVTLAEAEQSIRKLIRFCVNDDELKACASMSLKDKYRPEDMPTSLEEMTFDDYVWLVGDGRNWPRFEPAFGAGDYKRKSTRTKLEVIRDVRNVVFHFKRELKQQELEELLEHRDWLLTISRKIEAKFLPDSE